MKKTFLLACIALLCLLKVSASSLSPSAQVSIITCAAGEEIFEVFGHTAVRIQDPARHMDIAYNYGVFDFDRPDFFVNFAKGHLVYMIGAEDFKNFVDYYATYNRRVTEQVLNLTPEQKQAMFDYLENNLLPQNREYVYDYFYNNCSTKPRDVLEEVTHHQIKFDYAYAGGSHYSVRQLVNQYATKNSWGDLGIDIALGSATDVGMTPYQYMYLPEYLLKALDLAKITDDSITKPLVKRKIDVYTPHPMPTVGTDWASPLYVFWGVFILVALYTGIFFALGRPGYGIDVVLFGFAGIFGVVLVYISVFTDHHSGANYNLMWLFPLHLIAGIMLQFKALRNASRYYFAASSFILIILLCLFKMLPQGMNYTIIPLVLALLLRCMNVMYFERK